MTTLRLAWSSSNSPNRLLKCLGKEAAMTTLRLAVAHTHEHQRIVKTFGEEDVTQLRLAVCGPPEAIQKGLSDVPAPALLVSYVYMSGFMRMREKLHYRDWVLDSGAFSAHSKGTTIDLQAYIDTCKELRETDPRLTEVYSLDVIGDWKGTMRNTEEMWKQDVPAIPAFHFGSPEDVLVEMAKTYPKIALGGVARMKDKPRIEWAQQCFARVWPKRIHGFGFASERAMMTFPWHSVDATSWEMGPAAFGNWKSFGGNVGIRGGKMNLRAEVEWYLKLERRVQHRWAKEMAKLEELE